jgi:hypothetical protein
MSSSTRRVSRRGAWSTLALGALVALGGAIVPATALADTGATNTVKVLHAPTINPAATGGNFTVDIVANGSASISGAGSGLGFDKAKLQVVSLAKDTTEVANGVTYLGYPSSGNLAAFIATANTNGQIPNISWAYLDGASTESGNADHGIYSVTFHVTALGNNTLVPNDSPAILDGQVASYGNPLLPLTLVNGNVVNASVMPPTAAFGTVAAYQLGTSVALSWSGTPGADTIATYDVRYRKAAWNGAFAAYIPWQSATTSTTAPFALSPGYTYCFSALARDVNGLVSAWTAERCTVAPLDDRSLSTSGTWSRKTSSSFYRGTYSQSTKLNAKLIRTSAKFKRLYLVATTCSTCGSVKVYLGSTLLRSISLKSTKTVNKKVFAVYSSSTLKSGTISIKVTTSGKTVKIDGLALAKF